MKVDEAETSNLPGVSALLRLRGWLVSQPYVLLTLVPLFWAGNAVTARGVNQLISPITLAWIRWMAALALLTPFAWKHLQRDWPTIRQSWRMLLLLSVLGITTFNTLFYVALQTTQAINAALLQTAGPAVILLLTWWWFQERAGMRQWAGLVLCFLGVALVLFRGSWEVLLRFEMVPGDLWLIPAVISYAAYSTLLRIKPPMHLLSFLAVTFAAGGGLLTPLMVLEWNWYGLPHWSPQAAWAVAYVAIFPSILAYLCWNRGIELIGPSQSGLFLNLVPVFASLLAIVFLGEIFEWFHAMGMLLIVGGMLLFRKRPTA
jgi:drug/metabolite transporter (DMT)-like permease